MNKKQIHYSFLELAIVAEGESMQQTLNNAVAVAREAEKADYTRFWLAEHHNSDNIGSSATSVLAGYVAGNTERIRIGSGGIMLPNHSPLIVAEQFATLAHLYPDRIDLGLGRAPGTDQPTAQAIRSDFMWAAQRFPDEVDKIQQYFSPDNRRAAVRAPIAEGVEVPIYILGSSTDSAHLAAKKGLPYAFASHFASTYLLEALKIYRREFKPSEELDAPYTMAGVNIYIADTEEEAESLFSTLVKMFVGVLTGNRAPLQPPAPMTDELREVVQHPSLQQMLKYSFIGTKGTLKKQLQSFIRETEVDELIAVSAMYNLSDRVKSMRLFAEIMKEINS